MAKSANSERTEPGGSSAHGEPEDPPHPLPPSAWPTSSVMDDDDLPPLQDPSDSDSDGESDAENAPDGTASALNEETDEVELGMSLFTAS